MKRKRNFIAKAVTRIRPQTIPDKRKSNATKAIRTTLAGLKRIGLYDGELK